MKPPLTHKSSFSFLLLGAMAILLTGLATQPNAYAGSSSDCERHLSEKNSFKKSIRGIRSAVPLTKEDEKKVLQIVIAGRTEIQNGSTRIEYEFTPLAKRAIAILVETNLRFAAYYTYRYEGFAPFSTLISAAIEGLNDAAIHYKINEKTTFQGYAAIWMRKRIIEQLAAQSKEFKLNVNQFDLLNKITKYEIKFSTTHDRLPTDEEVATFLKISVERLKDFEAARVPFVSLDSRISTEEENSTLSQFIADEGATSPDQALERNTIQWVINSLLNGLEDNEKNVIQLYYGLGEGGIKYDLREIAKKINASKAWVSILKIRAEQKLSKYSNRIQNKNELFKLFEERNRWDFVIEENH